MYQWLVFTHLVGLVFFAMCHGVAIFSAFRIRGLRETAAVSDHLELAQRSSGLMYIGLILLAVGGIGAASSANLWGAAWITWSIVVFIAVIVAMYAIGSSYYRSLRDLVYSKDGAAPAEGYDATERNIRERRERGLFADMKFTMAQPEVSCHPELLLDGEARTVVSAALCYWADAPDPVPGEGRLPRYAWIDHYALLRERLHLGLQCGDVVEREERHFGGRASRAIERSSPGAEWVSAPIETKCSPSMVA